MEGFKKDAIIREASRGLADTQVEKLKSLVEGFDFDDSFESKVKTIVESHFAKEVVETSDDTILESSDADETVELSSSTESYVSAIKKISPKK